MKRISKIKSNLFVPLEVLTIIITHMIICSPRVAFATALVTVTDYNWTIGLTPAAFESLSGNQWTATNDNSLGSETLKMGVAVTGWTPSSTGSPGSNIFVLKLKNPTCSSGTCAANDTLIQAGNNWTLVSTLQNNGTVNFGLSFISPILDSTSQGAHDLTVTVAASSWVATQLTWTIGAHSEAACLALTAYNATVYTDTSNGLTFCKLNDPAMPYSISCPSGWTQAGNWQQYLDSGWEWGSGDACQRWKTTGPVTFANTVYHEYDWGTSVSCLDDDCTRCSQYFSFINDCWDTVTPDGGMDGGGVPCYYLHYTVTTSTNVSSFRRAIGCY